MDKEKDIVYLEPDEEIPSAISRLEEAKAKRIIFVVPKDAVLIHSVINLKLLKREAKKFGKKVVIVTSDEAGSNLARKAGFKVFSSVAQAKEGMMPEKIGLPQEEFARKSLDQARVIEEPIREMAPEEEMPETPVTKPKRKIFTFNFAKSKWFIIGASAIALALLGTVVYLYLPYAKITLYLKTETKNKDLKITLAANPTLNEVKAEIFEAEKEKTGQAVTTGSKEIGDSAKGKITIYNYWDSTPQDLVAQTRFQSLSTSKVFRIPSAVTVPGTTIQQGQVVAGSIEVEVVAEEVGAEYNIAPDKFVIPGLPQAKQAKIYGESKAPMTGGYKKTVRVVTEADCNNLKNSLKEDLKKQLLKEINSDLKNNKTLIKRDDFIIEDERSATCDPAIDSEANAVNAKIKLHLVLFAYKDQDLKTKLRESALSSIDPNKDLASTSFSQIDIKGKQADLVNKKLSLSLTTNLVLIAKLNLDVLKSNLYSRSRDEAIKYLDSFEEIEKSEITFFPTFLKKIPHRNSQIKIEIKPAE